HRVEGGVYGRWFGEIRRQRAHLDSWRGTSERRRLRLEQFGLDIDEDDGHPELGESGCVSSANSLSCAGDEGPLPIAPREIGSNRHGHPSVGVSPCGRGRDRTVDG